MKSISEMRERVLDGPRKTIAVAAAADLPVLEAIKDAVEASAADAVLVGDQALIEKYLQDLGLSSGRVEILDEPDAQKAAAKAVKLVRDGVAQVLMKGLIGTADFMRAVLNKEYGLRTGQELTHVSVFEVPKIDRLLIMTDPAMHTYPELGEKIKMLDAIKQVGTALEIEHPKVAVVCAVEVVNPAMQSTLDAAVLAKMSDRGQVKGMTVDGPLALDIALNEEAAAHKGVTGPVAGQADALLMPNIETGNVMWKTLVYMAEAGIAGAIVGAAAPIVLTSRSDSPSTKLNSIVLALLMAEK